MSGVALPDKTKTGSTMVGASIPDQSSKIEAGKQATTAIEKKADEIKGSSSTPIINVQPTPVVVNHTTTIRNQENSHSRLNNSQLSAGYN